MEERQIQQLFNKFIASYDFEAKDAIWEQQMLQFRDFWKNKIIGGGQAELNDLETDEIIKILDRHGKGNTKDSEAIAAVMIPQGVWRKMFNEIKANRKLSKLLNDVFEENNIEKKAALVDKVYEINEGRRNSLTGKSGNAINTMLAAYDPLHNLSVISLNDRRKIFEYFAFEGSPDFEIDSQGKKMIFSNARIVKSFTNLGISHSARTISVFFYSPEIKPLWKVEREDDHAPWGGFKEKATMKEELTTDPSLFYMESQLEDFLIENWDKTDLGKKYDLIEEEGELISQQYKTDIGRIDILAQDKKTKQYVVIELKKGQTSDDTVGQLTRYMGWLEAHKTGGQLTKGIIIAAQYDERLYYALKKLKDVEVYLYKVDFKLEEFKNN